MIRWVGSLFSRRRRYEDLSVSIQEHLEEKIDDLMSEGLTREEAEARARRAFGNVALIEERSRETWQSRAIESVFADARLALRRMAKNPSFTATVLLTLAIGIGANTAVFSVLNSVVLKPLPYPEPERLVTVSLQAPGAAGLANFRDGLLLSASLFLTFAEHNRTFQSLGVWNTGTANVTGIAQPEEVHTITVSSGLLETLAVPALAGRWLNAEDQQAGGRKSVMISYGYWQRRFGGDKGAIGQTIRLDTQSWQIVGIMPRGFRVVDSDFDVLKPSAFDTHKQIMEGFAWNGVGRLRDGVSMGQAEADIARLIPVWMDSWSDGPDTNSHFFEVWRITPAFKLLKQEVIGNIGRVLWLVMGSIGVVMLIACTNVANLLLVRADSRQQELAVRAALGAGRARIARELLTESLVLGTMGGFLGVAVAYGGLRLLSAIGPQNLPRMSEISLSGESIAFMVGLSILAGAFFGSIVALKYAGVGAGEALRGSGRTASVGRERHRVRRVLVVAQVAMALVLLVCAGLMIRTFSGLLKLQPGFTDPDHLQTMGVAILKSVTSDPVAVTRMQNEIGDKLAELPGVSSVGYAAAVPMENGEPNWNSIFVKGRDGWNKKSVLPMRVFNYTSPNYFHTLGSRLIAGREFTWDDVYNQRPVGILSENLARELFGSAQAAIGKQITVFQQMPWTAVIGVVEDIRQSGLDAPAPAVVYWPTMMANLFGPEPVDAVRGVTFVVRSPRAGSESLMQEMQQSVWQINGDLPVASLRTMSTIESKSMARTSFTLVMLTIAGAMALALGLLGIYGVISYSVTQRTREIGVRMALGAQKQELKWMFVRSAIVLATTGTGIGLVAAAGLTRLMKSLLFGISPLDPATYAAVALVLAAMVVLASYLPARRAASVDPVEALRAE